MVHQILKRFPNSKLVLIDPLIEAKTYAKNNLVDREYEILQYGVGEKE